MMCTQLRCRNMCPRAGGGKMEGGKKGEREGGKGKEGGKRESGDIW